MFRKIFLDICSLRLHTKAKDGKDGDDRGKQQWWSEGHRTCLWYCD